MIDFQWNEKKNQENIQKHGIAFEIAQYVFKDPKRIIVEDLEHSKKEKRYFCFGKLENEILTIRFTYRNNVIRIFGAGFWRKGRKIYEKSN